MFSPLFRRIHFSVSRYTVYACLFCLFVSCLPAFCLLPSYSLPILPSLDPRLFPATVSQAAVENPVNSTAPQAQLQEQTADPTSTSDPPLSHEEQLHQVLQRLDQLEAEKEADQRFDKVIRDPSLVEEVVVRSNEFVAALHATRPSTPLDGEEDVPLPVAVADGIGPVVLELLDMHEQQLPKSRQQASVSARQRDARNKQKVRAAEERVRKQELRHNKQPSTPQVFTSTTTSSPNGTQNTSSPTPPSLFLPLLVPSVTPGSKHVVPLPLHLPS